MGKFLVTQNSESAPCLTFRVKASWKDSPSATAKTTTPPLLAREVFAATLLPTAWFSGNYHLGAISARQLSEVGRW